MTTIGIDLGGTKVSAAHFDESGNILFKKKLELHSAKGKEVGRIITSVLSEIIKSATSSGHAPHGIGLSVPGIAHRSGEVWAPNITGWEKYPIKKELEAFVENEYKIIVDSDRACHMMGEVWKGAAKGCRDAVFLAVGTGIGAGIMAEGRVLRGAHDISGAIGWMALRPPYQAMYKERGCFETYASGHGIADRARQLLRERKVSILSEKIENLTAESVFEAYDQHDAVARAVIDEAIQYWGMATSNLVSFFNPEKIIFGGGVFGPAIKLIDLIYAEAVKWGQPISMQQVKFEASALGADAALIGAGYLALKTENP